METDEVRTVLQHLADGTMSAAEAERALSELEDGDATEPVPPPQFDDGDRRRGTVRGTISSGGLIEVRCEAIDRPRIEGPNDCWTTETDEGFRVDGQVGDDTIVVVPVGFDLDLGLHGADAVIRGVDGPLRAEVNTGGLAIDGRFNRGRSRIVANVGDIHVALTRDSDVTVVVLGVGTINASAPVRKTGRGEWTLGAGTAELEFDGHFGSIDITVV